MARNLTEWGRLLEEAGVTAPPNEPSQIARAATASRDGQIGGSNQLLLEGRRCSQFNSDGGASAATRSW